MPLSLEYLLNRYADKTCTNEEREQLMQLLQQSENDQAVLQIIDKMLAERAARHTMESDNSRAVLAAIFEAAEAPVIPIEKDRTRRFSEWRIAAAATIVGILVVAGWLWLMPHHKGEITKTENKPVIKNDVAPGGNKAVLTLANGSTIILDNASNGTLASEGNIKVVKLSNGQLVYKVGDSKAAASGPVTYNTLSTPKGGQYQLYLPDGSKVWLNSASSITFPTAFAGNERKVAITGEAYFEVTHDARKPFKVEKGNVTVEVLGTHFNVNAYDDEDAIKTTLLEGKVKVSIGGQADQAKNNKQQTTNFKLLSPGQQAQIKNNNELSVINNPNIEQVMAWKNGLFHFEDADLKMVMRQLCRWYDIEVEYKGTVKNEPLFIEVPRNTNLSEVLKVIESTAGVKMTIEGKKVIVL